MSRNILPRPLPAALQFLFLCAAAPALAGAEVRLPDGTNFPFWEPATTYTRTYVVDQNHPAASDENPGTSEQPFLTINHAAQLLRPGERVVVQSGTYREQIQPARGGSGPEAMISYEAAPGAHVAIKGSRIVAAPWVRSLHPVHFSEKLWMIPLPAGEPPDDNPFLRANCSDEEFKLMPWATDYTGRAPYSLPRGLLFQDGRRMVQMQAYADLIQIPGTYWVDPAGRLLHLHPFDDRDPNECVMEYTAQHFLFKPRGPDLGYVHVKGLHFMHAGNGLPRTGEGAVSTNGGHHWVFEDNVVAEVNSVGLEIGARALESSDEAVDHAEGRRAAASPGANIVRHCEFVNCGRNGVQGYVVRHALVEDNYIHDCGWLDVERYYESAGIKLLSNQGTLVRHNRIARITGSPAIWLDWDNRNCRITRNVVSETSSSCNGSLFIEASREPNMIDHNIVWRVHGTAIFAGDTDRLLILHNLVAYSSGPPVRLQTVTDRMLAGRRMSSQQHVVRNNLFVGPQPPEIHESENFCDYNTYVATGDRPGSTAWFKSGWDSHSTSLAGRAEFDGTHLELALEGVRGLPAMPASADAESDFFEAARPDGATSAGPFAPDHGLRWTLNEGGFGVRQKR